LCSASRVIVDENMTPDEDEAGAASTDDPLEVVRLLGSKYSAEILGATHEPRSAKDLSEALDIPIATSYRRVNALEESGLLEHTDSVLTDERKRMDVYRRSVDRLVVEFSEAGTDVRVEDRGDIKNKLDDVWRTLSGSGG
jgi:predicted transcriptional regulator